MITKALTEALTNGPSVLQKSSSTTYFVKWQKQSDETIIIQDIKYETIDQALSSACEVLTRDAGNVWIEDKEGVRIAEYAYIVSHCSNSQRVT